MFDSLVYADFFNIIMVAIAVNLTYIIIDNKKSEERNEFAFFGFLSTVSNKILDWMSYLRSKSQKKEEATQTKLEYYINSQKLKSETKGAFEMLIRELSGNMSNTASAEEKAKHRINACCKAENLAKISLVCTLYGIYLLFLGGLEVKCQTINIHAGILICNIVIAFMLAHCLLWEKRTIQCKVGSETSKYHSFLKGVNCSFDWIGKFFAPRFIIYLFLFVAVIIYSMCVTFNGAPFLSEWLKGYNHINLFISLMMCFSGFIIYTIVALIFSIVFLFRFRSKLNKINIKGKVADVETKVEHYKKELESIDEQMKKSVEESKFS